MGGIIPNPGLCHELNPLKSPNAQPISYGYLQNCWGSFQEDIDKIWYNTTFKGFLFP
jgi:hypothetical protein